MGKLPRRGRLFVYSGHIGMGRGERYVEDRLKSQPTNSWREPKGDVAYPVGSISYTGSPEKSAEFGSLEGPCCSVSLILCSMLISLKRDTSRHALPVAFFIRRTSSIVSRGRKENL